MRLKKNENENEIIVMPLSEVILKRIAAIFLCAVMLFIAALLLLNYLITVNAVNYNIPAPGVSADSSTGTAATDWFLAEVEQAGTGDGRYGAYGDSTSPIAPGSARNYPYIIRNGDELAYLAMLVNGTAPDPLEVSGYRPAKNFQNEYISLEGTLVGDEYVIDVLMYSIIFYQSGPDSISYVSCDTNDNNTGWVPIGLSSETPFAGKIFSGNSNGYVEIHNMRGIVSNFSNATTDPVNYSHYGLFGYVTSNSLEISDIHLVDAQVFIGTYSTIQKGQTSNTYSIGSFASSIRVGLLAGEITGTNSGDVTLEFENCSVRGVAPGEVNGKIQIEDGEITSIVDGTYIVPDFTIRCDSQNVYLGGYFGRSGSSSTLQINGCDFMGRIVSSSNYGTGGFIGIQSGTVTFLDSTVSGVSSNAPLEMDVQGHDQGGYVGVMNGNLIINGLYGNGVEFNNVGFSQVTSKYMYRIGGVVGYATTAGSINISSVGTSAKPFLICLGDSETKVSLRADNGGSDDKYGGFAGIIGFDNITAANSGARSISHSYVSLNANVKNYNSNNNYYIGGIVGRINVDKNTGYNVISYSVSYCNVSDMTVIGEVGSYSLLNVGGIVGAATIKTASFNTTDNLTNSVISSCTVTNANLASDGMSGGIIGTSTSSSVCGFSTITGCRVSGLKIIPCTTGSFNFQLTGGIVPRINGEVTYCEVEGFELEYLNYNNTTQNSVIGGIVGELIDNSQISNCAVSGEINLGNSYDSFTPYYVGGIAGAIYANNNNQSISNCSAYVRLNVTNFITLCTGTTRTITPTGSYVAGGIVGGIVGENRVTIQNCFATGDIDFSTGDLLVSTRQNTLGGLIGNIYRNNQSTVTVANCISTMSVSGNTQDAIGGLIGYTSTPSLAVRDCTFGGTVLNPNASSITMYQNGGAFTNVKYNAGLSPQATSVDNAMLATDSRTALTNPISNPSTLQEKIFNAGKEPVVAVSANENVFAYSSSFPIASDSTTYTQTVLNETNEIYRRDYAVTTFSNGLGVYRRARLLTSLNTVAGCTGNGSVNSPYVITSGTIIELMPEYVENGGGWLGSSYTLGGNVSAALAAPIGGYSNGHYPFSGTLDGGNYIVNLTAAEIVSNGYSGMFGYVLNGNFQNVNIVYPNATSLGTGYTGCLAGNSMSTTVYRVNVRVSNGVSTQGTATGGLIGYAQSTTFNECSFTGKLNGLSDTGGIIGLTGSEIPRFKISTFTSAGQTQSTTKQTGTLYGTGADTACSSCYTAGDINGGQTSTGIDIYNSSNYTGGIIGRLTEVTEGVINSCFMYGNVSGGTHVGGLVGIISSVTTATPIKSCYVIGNVYSVAEAAGIVGTVTEAGFGANLCTDSYYVGQPHSMGTVTALCSTVIGYTRFYYDRQVSGSLNICLNTVDPLAGVDSDVIVESFSSQYNTSINDITAISLYNQMTADGATVGTYVPTITIADPENNNTPISLSFSDGGVLYNDTTTSDTLWAISTTQNRILKKYKNSEDGELSITFTGTGFTLSNYISNGLDAYTVYIDNIPVSCNGAVLMTAQEISDLAAETLQSNDISSTLPSNATVKWYKKTVSDSILVRFISNSNTSDSYLVFASKGIDNSLVADSRLQVLNISGLSLGEHTIRIKACNTKSNSYINIANIRTILDADVPLEGAIYYTDPDRENYAELNIFRGNPNVSAVSGQSVIRLYDFNSIGDNNRADNFTDTMTEFNGIGISYTRDTVGAGLYNSTTKTYTYPASVTDFDFVVTSSRSVNGYTLEIDEQIIMTPFAGNGTEEDPFRIPDVPTLIAFREFVNNVTGGTSGQYFKLTMTNGDIYNLVGTTYNDTLDINDNPVETVIGTNTNQFQGYFDGNGKTIRGLSFNAAIPTDINNYTELVYGLFGYASGAEIYNLTVEGGITVTQLQMNPFFAGLVLGKGTNVKLRDITARCDGKQMPGSSYSSGTISIDEYYTSTGSYLHQAVGGIAGGLYGTTNASGLISVYDIEFTMSRATGKISGYDFNIGGAIGYVVSDENGSVNISDCITYGTIDEMQSGSVWLANMDIGGVIGEVAAGCHKNLSRLSAYGTIYTSGGGIGGVLGSMKNTNEFYGPLFIDNLYCNSTIVTELPVNNSDSYTGGIIGYFYGNVNSVTNCVFSGELLTYTKANTANISNPIRGYSGGVFGRYASGIVDASSGNYFDITKNPDFESVKRMEEYIYAEGRKSYELIDPITGRYASPTYAEGAFCTNTETAAIKAAIIAGNTTALGVVKSMNCCELLDTVPADPVFGASSVFVYHQSGMTLNRVSDTASATLITTSGRRIVSTLTNSTARVTVQIVSMNNGVDQLLGLGKKLVYFPSIEATGIPDASYLAADPAGDGISGNGISFTIYNEDQLEGLDTLVSGDTNDAGGILTTVSVRDSEYTVVLGCDIVFDKSTYLTVQLIYRGAIPYPLSGSSNWSYITVPLNSNYYNTVIGYRAGGTSFPFTGTLDGNNHTISGMIMVSDSGSVGLFHSLDGATVTDLGITDSTFTAITSSNTYTIVNRPMNQWLQRTVTCRTVNGYVSIVTEDTYQNKTEDTLLSTLTVSTPVYTTFNVENVGSLAGSATDTVLRNCFCSARIEQEDNSPSDANIGGFFGVSAGVSFDGCAFTGSVGVTAISNSSYQIYDNVNTENFRSGGFIGFATGNSSFTDCYTATYIYGISNASAGSYIGHFIGLSTGSVTFNSGCAIDYDVGAEGCNAVGNDTGTRLTGLVATNGFYPAITGFESNDREKCARVCVSIYAASVSEASLSVDTTAVFSHVNYIGAFTVYSSPTGDKYILSEDGKTLTRNNNGIASVLVEYNGYSRMILANLQCWYDNFTTEGNVKTYTIKNASELIELAQLISAGNDLSIGHNHDVTHQIPGIAEDGFSTAIIRLGADIYIDSDIRLIPIGTSPKPFMGTFDGNGYAIIDPVFSGNTDLGLFGYNSGVIRNVLYSGNATVHLDSMSMGTVYAGLVAAHNNGTVTACENGAAVTITVDSDARLVFGALAGENNGVLTDCFNMGHIKSDTINYVEVGGVVGQNTTTISRCYNTGILEGAYDGSGSEPFLPTTLAGIAVRNTGTVDECYNAGVILNPNSGNLYPIAVGGTVSDCYLVYQTFYTSYIPVDLQGITQILISEFTDYSAGTVPTAFDSSKWTCETGYYPQLSAFNQNVLSQSVSEVSTLAPRLGDAEKYDSFESIVFEVGSVSSVSIIEKEGNKGTYTRGGSETQTVLTVNNRGATTLYVETNVGGVTLCHELYFINDDIFTIRYMFDFSSLMDNATQSIVGVEYNGNTFSTAGGSIRIGTGNSGDPYLINTAEDFAAFAAYINSNNGVNRYFKLINDLSFSGYAGTLVPVGTAQYPFRGTFNGAGHTISGIKQTESVSTGTVYGGVFGYIGETGTVGLLAVENCLFDITVEGTATAYVGALAGYCKGTLYDCYARSVVKVQKNSVESLLYSGGLVGGIDEKGAMLGCYARPATDYNMWDGATAGNSQPFVSYVTTTNANGFYGGILIGITNGTVTGCYHTAMYFRPSITGYTPYGVIAGKYAGGRIMDVYYNSSTDGGIDSPSLQLFIENNVTQLLLTVMGNEYAMSNEEFRSADTETTDGAALKLSQNLYIGTYRNAPLNFTNFATTTNYGAKYQNDGFPVLAAFDLAQYTFAELDGAELILYLKNSGTLTRTMCTLCSYDSFDFPRFASITAQERLYIKALSLPLSLTYNVSAVGYGFEEVLNPDETTSFVDIKTTVRNGYYTNLNGHDGGLELSTNESAEIRMLDENSLLPENCDKIFIYISILRSDSDNVNWGVHKSWNSSELGELEPEFEE